MTWRGIALFSTCSLIGLAVSQGGFESKKTAIREAIVSGQATPGAAYKTAEEVANHLWRASGVQIYIDSRVAKERVPMPPADAEISEATLQSHVEKLTKSLSQGAVWAKLYLPPPPKGKAWKADDVVAYARAQAGLYGTVGAVASDTIEVLAVKLPFEKAKEVMVSLGLLPVYVVSVGRGNFGGVWQTTFGEMRLTQTGTRVVGTYGGTNGEIEGTAGSREFRGRWYEQNRTRGGPVHWTLSQDGDDFAGQWAYDEGIQTPSAWTGKRVSRK